MSEETLKTWFKFVYEMVYDIYRTTGRSTRGGEPLQINEQIAAAVKTLTYGLETPDPRRQVTMLLKNKTRYFSCLYLFYYNYNYSFLFF